MTRLAWALAWTAVAVWSLLAWAAYGLVGLFGGLLARGADLVSSDPGTVEAVFNGLSFLRDAGLGVVAVLWAVVSLAILAVPFVLSRARARVRAAQPGLDNQIVYPPGGSLPFAVPRPDDPRRDGPRR
jgi:hypothetical protein